MNSNGFYATIMAVVMFAGIFYIASRPEASSPETADASLSSRSQSTEEASQAKADPVKEALRIALNPSAGLEARVKAIHSLPRNLGEAERQQVLSLVEDKTAHPTLRNDALALLEVQEVKNPQLGDMLIGMYRDEAESDTWKDYSLQHLAPCYGFSDTPDAITNLLTAVAKGGPDSFAGTAMISLQRIGREHRSMRGIAEAIAAEKNATPVANSEAELTAIQVARQANDRKVLPKCREIAVKADLKTRLRMSAIATLGQIGDPEDVSLLRRLSEDKNRRIANAASASLKTIEKRLN